MDYDVVIIGAGHNGLAAATLLAGKGKKVLVLEKQEMVGGLAGQHEFHPGYKSNGLLQDTSGIRSKVIKKLKLQKYGLKVSAQPPAVTLLSRDDQAITLFPDAQQTYDSIAKYSSQDAQAYLQYHQFKTKIRGFITGLLDQKQPDLTNIGPSQYWQLFKQGWALNRLGKKTMMEFLKVAPMSVADFLNGYFETEFLKSGMALPALLGSFTGPWSSYTTLNLLLWESTAQQSVVGGPVKLVDALQQASQESGVEIQCSAEVEQILLNGSGEVQGVKLRSGDDIPTSRVIASCSPKETFLRLLSGNQIGPTLDYQISKLRSRGTTAKINLALNQKIKWKVALEGPVEFVRTATSLDEMEKAFDAIKYRGLSHTLPLDIHIPTVINTDIAPEGHEVVSILAQFTPYDLDGGWTPAAKDQLVQNVVKTLSQYTVDLESSVVATQVLTPLDIEQQFNIAGGHIFHLEHAIDQLIGRPVPSCAQYETPISGLYLGGSGSHPGGGLTCIPGMLASQRVFTKM